MRELIPIPKLSNKDMLRFTSKLSNMDDSNSCWEWTAARDSTGYGNFAINKKFYRASRIAAALWLSKPDIGKLQVLHRCDNPPCCNPAHLFYGSQSDNMKDAFAKGRHSIPPSPRQVLNQAQVLEIRASSLPTRELVSVYKVSRIHIARIRRGATWKTVS